MAVEPTKGKARSAIRRGVAVLLIVALLSALMLYRKTDISLNADDMENKGAHVAATQLLQMDGYVNAPRLNRMTAYARRLIGGEHTFADYEAASQIAVAQNQYADAVAFTRKSIELCPDNAEAYATLCLRLGYLYTLQADYQNALEWLDKGLAVADSPEAQLTRAQVKLNLGDTDGALADVTGYLQKAEDAMPMLPDLINVYEAAGQFDTAATLYTRLIDETGDEDYLLNRAYCYTTLNRMTEAAADCERYAAAGGAEAGSANVMLGIGWMRNGDYAAADECFIRAIDQKYSDPESLYYYVVLCAYITENYSRACEYGDALIDRILRGEASGTASIQVENTTGKLNVALAEIDRASLCLMTGASHVRMGDYEQAVDSLTACLQQDSNAAYANYLRGSCLLAAERFEEAIPDFDTAIAAGEEEEKSRYGRGVCRMQLGDNQGAMDDFDWVVLNGKNKDLFDESSRLILKLMQDNPVETEAPETPEATETPETTETPDTTEAPAETEVPADDQE